MPLSKAERRIAGEIEKIIEVANYNWRDIEEYGLPPEAGRSRLEHIKRDFIRMKVIADYVCVDELLSILIVSYFFQRPGKIFP